MRKYVNRLKKDILPAQKLIAMHKLCCRKNVTFFFARPICHPSGNLTYRLNIKNNTLDKWKLNTEMDDKFRDIREIYVYARCVFSSKVIRETNLQLRLQ